MGTEREMMTTVRRHMRLLGHEEERGGGRGAPGMVKGRETGRHAEMAGVMKEAGGQV